jgi:hypothetical protein
MKIGPSKDALAVHQGICFLRKIKIFPKGIPSFWLTMVLEKSQLITDFLLGQVR